MDKEKEAIIEEWFGNNNIIHHLNKSYEKAPEHKQYSFEYWLYRLASLCKGEGRDGYDFMLIKNVYNASRDFAWCYGDWLKHDYACNPSAYNDKDDGECSSLTLNELCKTNIRFASFKQDITSEVWSSYFADASHVSPEMQTFAQKQRTAVFVTEDGFANDKRVHVVEAASADEAMAIKRATYTRTKDLRHSFKELIRTIRPLLKDKVSAKEACKLYRDLYNFTNLDWYFHQ